MRGIKKVALYDERGKRLVFEDRVWTIKLLNLACGCSRLRLTGYRLGPAPVKKPHGRKHG